MPDFTCVTCNATFSLGQATLDKYPGWTPRYCRQHSKKKGGAKRNKRAAVEENLTLTQVLQRYTGGPQDGVFTDGSCSPNPGAGGWGVVWVAEGDVLQQSYGREAATTNNRMELKALIEALKMLPTDARLNLYSDSQLCVKTVNEWAPGWERRGWKRKSGPIKNLDLVQELFALSKTRPHVKLTWLAAHSGNLWNEYADSLATAWMREEL